MLDGTDQSHDGDHQEKDAAGHNAADDGQACDHAGSLASRGHSNQDEAHQLKQGCVSQQPLGLSTQQCHTPKNQTKLTDITVDLFDFNFTLMVRSVTTLQPFPPF